MAVRHKKSKGARTRNRLPRIAPVVNGPAQGFVLGLSNEHYTELGTVPFNAKKLAEPQLLKVQRPLHSSAAQAPALVYNRDRSITYELPYEAVENLFASQGKPLKLYVVAGLEQQEDKTVFRVKEIVKNQEW
jgi:hypothetical protein